MKRRNIEEKEKEKERNLTQKDQGIIGKYVEDEKTQQIEKPKQTNFDIFMMYFETIIFWIITIFINKKWEILNNLISNEKLHNKWIFLSAICTINFIAIFIYLAVYLPKIKKINVDWSSYENIINNHKNAMFFATISGVLLTPFFVIGIWPVYRLFSIPFTAAFGLTFLFTVRHIPFN
ncbi:transmembrane protein [Anaeramoeba ignava]|uniref:Transmembrane protein n=1 Tax=Anaeramoeba ignava TaxID=1746090 RepID=A0A9Q0LPE9_ANAIG|nr:transmembrane protein [Anaeramoeba ignava]